MTGTRRLGSVRARLAVFVASAMVLTASLSIGAPVAFASTPPTSSCSWGDVTYTIDTMVKPYRVTHEAVVSLAPYTQYSQSTTLGRVDSITASVSGTLSGTAEQNLVLAKASVTASLTLKTSGSSTVSSSVTYSWTITNNSSVQRRYVVFTAPHRVTGSYTKWQCNRWENWYYVTSGTYLSFDYEMRGTALCGYSYASGSAERLAQAYCP